MSLEGQLHGEATEWCKKAGPLLAQAALKAATLSARLALLIASDDEIGSSAGPSSTV